MTAIPHSHHQSFNSIDAGRAVGVIANLERFGREIVWMLIAVAFCVVEAAVFLTDLPLGKLFGRGNPKR